MLLFLPCFSACCCSYIGVLFLCSYVGVLLLLCLWCSGRCKKKYKMRGGGWAKASQNKPKNMLKIMIGQGVLASVGVVLFLFVLFFPCRFSLLLFSSCSPCCCCFGSFLFLLLHVVFVVEHFSLSGCLYFVDVSSFPSMNLVIFVGSVVSISIAKIS